MHISLNIYICRFWWLKIQALGESGDWVELEKFSKGKKAPVGMEVCNDSTVGETKRLHTVMVSLCGLDKGSDIRSFR